MSDEIDLQSRGPVAVITLDRPEVYNALNMAMLSKISKAIDAVEKDDKIRVIMLRGAGAGFCAGADLGEVGPASTSQKIETVYKPLLLAVANSSKIWLASVHGSAAGIGAAFALNCDLVVMADDANIYLAFAAIGLIPDGGANWLLLRGMGYARAFATVVEGRKIPAQECVELGLANKMFPGDTVHEESIEWARRLAEGAPLAQAAAKRVLRRAGGMSFGDSISMEAAEQGRLAETRDFKSGVAAFFDKRKPEFSGN